MHLHIQHPPHVVFPVAVTFFTVDIAAVIGLWCFFSWARWLFLVALLGSVILSVSVPHSPVMTVASWLEMWIACTINGIMIAMMFLPPTAGMFASRKV